MPPRAPTAKIHQGMICCTCAVLYVYCTPRVRAAYVPCVVGAYQPGHVAAAANCKR
jgi:hypothetical protein